MKPISKYILLNHIEESKNWIRYIDDGDEANKKDTIGKVISVGEEVSAVSKGDVVYYDHRGAHTLLIEGVQVTVIQERM